MQTRILGTVLVVLVLLGGLNVAKSIRGSISEDAVAKDEAAPVVATDLGSDERVMIDRTFDVQAGQRLLVDVQHSDLTIETGPVSEARIVVTIESSDMEEAVAKFEQMNFEAASDASGIFLTSGQDEDFSWSGFWDRVRLVIKVRVLIPDEFDLDLASSHGDVLVSALHGDVRLETTHGDVTTAELTGESIEIRTTHGELLASAIEAPHLVLQTTHGGITVASVTSDDFSAQTTHSDVAIETLSGSADISTTHGDVTIAVRETGGLSVSTTHGSVELALPKDLGADLELDGDPVYMESDTKFDGETDRKRVVGSLNGGGARVEVSTTHGSIRVTG